MTQTKYLIIGGGVAGTNAAEVIRHHDPSGTITLLTEEKERLYSRVLLPQYLRGLVPLERVFLKKPDFYSLNSINFLPESKVTRVDTGNKVVELENGAQFSYEKLLLATGNHLLPWEVTGADLDGVFYLRTVEGAQALKLKQAEVKEAVVVGGGFIALELAVTFRSWGLQTTLLVKEPYFFQKFLDEEGGRLIQQICQENGIRIITDDEVYQVRGTGKVEEVVTKKGQRLATRLVGVGIGVKPKLGYLEGSKVVRGTHITTNEYLETSVAGVWAAGDVTNFYDKTTERFHALGNWANAADQGRVAGLNMAGIKTEFKVVSTYSLPFFGNSLAIIGDVDQKYAETHIVRHGEAGRGLLYFHSNKLIGATLINFAADRGPLTNIIKNQTVISDPTLLADSSVDLNRFLHETS